MKNPDLSTIVLAFQRMKAMGIPVDDYLFCKSRIRQEKMNDARPVKANHSRRAKK